MGSETQGIREVRKRVAAHYQVTDLVVRRDWYSVACMFAAGEVSETDWQGVASLLANVSIDELALLDAQLQLAGISRPRAVSELTKLHERIVVASALELSRRRRYLQQQLAQDASFEGRYRSAIEKDLRRAVSYSYSTKESAITIRTTHQLLDAIKSGLVSSEEWTDALMIVLRRDPMLLPGLVDDGFVSLRDAGHALDQTPIAPIDAMRVLASLPELITKDRLALFSRKIDLGAIAQLRDEIPNSILRNALNDRTLVLIREVVENESDKISRYGVLYGNEYGYSELRQQKLRAKIEQLDDEALAALRRWVDSTDLTKDISILRTLPVLQGHDVIETLELILLLGARFDWATNYADQLYALYGYKWLTESKRVVLINDEASIVGRRERKRFTRINMHLHQFSHQFTLSAQDLLLHAPSLKIYINKIASGRSLHREDLSVLAYLSAADPELRSQVVRRLDERAFSDLLNLSIDGSSLAKGFFCSLDNADILYLMLRWGTRTRNGYLLWLVESVAPTRHWQLYQESQARRLDTMTITEIDNILAVLVGIRDVASVVTSEESIAFIDQLVKTYGIERAGQFVRAAGVRRASELTSLSPFYVKLLIDMYDEDLSIDRLQGLEETLTYEQAQEIQQDHYRQKQSFAAEVVASLQRSLSGGDKNMVQQVAAEAIA